MSEPGRQSVIVVGAGVVGLSIALRLQHAGNDVTIIDRQAPGRGCSYGNVGRIATECVEPLASLATLRAAPGYLLSPDGPLSIRAAYALRILPWLLRFVRASMPAAFRRGVAALLALQQHSLPAMTRLLDDAGIGSLLKARGHLVVSEAPDAVSALEAVMERAAQFEIVSTLMNRHDVRQLAPELTDNVQGGLYFPDTAHVVDPFRLCRKLARAVEQLGGRVRRGEVRAVGPAADKGFDVHVDGDREYADALVIAAGAWSAPLARQLGHRLPLETERGYHVTASGWNTDLRLPVESLERRTVMTPMTDGLRISGFVELGGLALPEQPSRYRVLREHLHALLPGADLSKHSEWMGFRPSLPDHLPVIGRCRRHPNAILALGHQHLGLTLSAVTADIVLDLLRGTAPSIDITPFRCNRFSPGFGGAGK